MASAFSVETIATRWINLCTASFCHF